MALAINPANLLGDLLHQGKMGVFTHRVSARCYACHYSINMMQDNQNPLSSTPELQREIALLMIEALNLETSVEQITADAPLYGDGLGLDSIDVLEIALVMSKHYGVQLRADSADNQHIFSSLRSLSDYIAAHRTR